MYLYRWFWIVKDCNVSYKASTSIKFMCDNDDEYISLVMCTFYNLLHGLTVLLRSYSEDWLAWLMKENAKKWIKMREKSTISRPCTLCTEPEIQCLKKLCNASFIRQDSSSTAEYLWNKSILSVLKTQLYTFIVHIWWGQGQSIFSMILSAENSLQSTDCSN